ncbi:MAG: 2'-5' RNA ligase [Bacteroidia bacterium]|nr:2'-5' RNA ligase [Bacteroidia bacterium]
MNEFSEFEKIPETLRNAEENEKYFREIHKLTWAVTEKIHGANFSFVYEDHQLKYAKRREYLSWADDFFGFQSVVNKIENQILAFFVELNREIKAQRYILYGELFGGKYPHPGVIPDKNFQAIQTGVYYAPDIHFCAFDVAIEPGEDTPKYYLDYDKAVSYFQKYNIFHAKVLFEGKFNEAIHFNTRISSLIPAMLGLPALEKNLIEGIVIKPLRHQHLAERPVLKIKNKEFEEVQYHQAEKWSFIPEIRSHSADLSFILEAMRDYLTLNRLESCISKTGAPDIRNPERMSEIQKEFTEDILTDFSEACNNILDELNEEQLHWIITRINLETTRFIHDYCSRKG